ncbi:MAG: hypothetical protein GF346_13730 [Candidatus Eisenbacteria bacterium]|nr:hypothetical protein [Candidatus Latescibacterota bacterium]MBD3303501.1 hypothetical protein [Candidatus Eisenbacteria bacterium]
MKPMRSVAVRRRRARWVLALFLFLPFVAGCATVGRSFPSEKVSEIELGETTKSDLLLMFGRPYRRGIEDGDSTWTYVHYKVRLIGGTTQTRDLYLRFDGETVRSYTYNADVP